MATVTQRQTWMATLAKAELELLEKLVNKLGTLPSYSFLRSPEIGLTMVRGRAGGTGEPFNLGEITMTRCVLQLESQAGSEAMPTASAANAGFGYVAGRSHRHAGGKLVRRATCGADRARNFGQESDRAQSSSPFWEFLGEESPSLSTRGRCIVIYRRCGDGATTHGKI